MASDMHFGASSAIFKNAEQLREALTPAEAVLWEQLRMNRLNGFRFKCQHPISHFIADFYCHKARLIIEIDGGVHDAEDQREHDANRTYILNEFGLTVIRFRNEEVLHRMNNVLDKIASFLV